MSERLVSLYFAAHYFLEDINSPLGIWIIRAVMILIAAFVVGFYAYIRRKK